jgi:UDP-N-acetylglucosamine 1-carboxyvinyltransferase
MEEIVIHGGRRLIGTVRINGSKNAALPIMAASLLTEGETIIHGAPRLRDVDTIAGMLRSLGVSVDWLGPQSLRLCPHPSEAVVTRFDLARQMRAGLCVLGPLVVTRGAALVSQPGGCVFGPRPIGLHLKGLHALGARVRLTRTHVYARAARLRGARLDMAGRHGSTVLGTDNVMMAAALAEGRTVIENAAREPETQDLAHYLNACGARISGIGTSAITVDGVRSLHGTQYTIIPDRIEAGTFMAAAALTGGPVIIEGVRPEHMQADVEALRRMGAGAYVGRDSITVWRSGPLRPVDLATAPFPGLPTDLHAQLAVLLCLADGTSTVHEGIYPERFTHVPELKSMGARIAQSGPLAVMSGVPALHGEVVKATDLRMGAALVLAGLAAQGSTVIRGVDQIDRGYQGLEERLRALGAQVHRRQVSADEYPERKSA